MVEAKSDLSRSVEAVESGTEAEIIISRDGKPAAQLVPMSAVPTDPQTGVAKGRFSVPDDMDTDTDTETMKRLFSDSAEVVLFRS